MPDLTKSSYEFHSGLESPLVFFRREWKAIAFFGGGFCLILIAASLWIDPAFFYPRLQTDPLFYYLKAKSLVETGSTSARLAVNVDPFAYAAMPGVMRAPVLWLFDDFDTQWRAIQLLNIPVLGSIALMSAYMLSWTQPQRRHWMAIAFAFGFTLLSPVWIANFLSPLADAPYAAVTLFGLLVAIRIFCSPGPIRDQRVWIAVFAVTFVVAFFLRFTAPVLFVFAATLAIGRWKGKTFSKATSRLLILAPIAATIVLVGLNFQAIFGRYLREPIVFVLFGDKVGMLLNLLGLATPDQIIPDFHLGFSQPPIIDTFYGEFSHTRTDALWTVVGLSISAIVIFGMWRSRHKFLPEILYLLAPLSILALMMPSTSRYLMSYQPLFWIFFAEGASGLATRFVPAISITKRSRAIIAAATLLVIGVAGYLRWSRVAGTGVARSYAVSVAETADYVHQVGGTFRSLRDFLETLPRDQTLLVGSFGLTGRWKAIADRSYYMPDSALSVVAAQKQVYLVVECGTLEYCQSFPEWKNRMKDKLCNFGEFTYDSVFAVRTRWARAEVFRVKPAI